MSLTLKILAVATPIVGGGIAIPLYLKSSGDLTTSGNSLSKNSSEKVECTASDIEEITPNLVSFLGKRSKRKEEYGYVTCKGTKDSLFGDNWMGLFPKETLEVIFSAKEQKNFPINVSIFKTQQARENIVIVFENSQKSSSVRGRWNSYLGTDFGKNVVLLPIEEDERNRGDIYILTDKIDFDKIK